MTRPEVGGIAPFFIVGDLETSLAFYRDRLGFEVTYQGPDEDPCFGIVERGGAMLMLKDVEVAPLSNRQRDDTARWDAYLYVPDPDALAAEFEAAGVEFLAPLGNNSDNLRGFELKDADGYVLYFGRPWGRRGHGLVAAGD